MLICHLFLTLQLQDEQLGLELILQWEPSSCLYHCPQLDKWRPLSKQNKRCYQCGRFCAGLGQNKSILGCSSQGCRVLRRECLQDNWSKQTSLFLTQLQLQQNKLKLKTQNAQNEKKKKTKHMNCWRICDSMTIRAQLKITLKNDYPTLIYKQ